MDRSTTLDDRSTTLDGVKSIAITAATTAADPSDTDPGEIGQNPAPPSFWLRNPLDVSRLGKKPGKKTLKIPEKSLENSGKKLGKNIENSGKKLENSRKNWKTLKIPGNKFGKTIPEKTNWKKTLKIPEKHYGNMFLETFF